MLEILKKIIKMLLDFLKKEAGKVLKRWIFGAICVIAVIVIIVLVTILAAVFAPGFYPV